MRRPMVLFAALLACLVITGAVIHRRQSQRAERLQAVIGLIESGSIAAATLELESLVADYPNDATLLISAAGLAREAADADRDKPDYNGYKRAAGFARRAIRANDFLATTRGVREDLAEIYFDEARAFAQEGNTAEAVISLKDALASGFHDVDSLEHVAELEPVRALPDFADLLKTASRQARGESGKALTASQFEIDQIFAETPSFEFDFDLTDIEGAPIAIADLKGKIAVIDIWGTWCPPCREEIPHFIALQKKYRDAGVEIVGLNFERVPATEALQKVRDFHQKNRMNYRCALITKDIPQQVPGFRGYPTTLFCDRTGKVRAMTVGAETLETLDLIVSRLLDESPATK